MTGDWEPWQRLLDQQRPRRRRMALVALVVVWLVALLLWALPAHAAATETWKRIAQCESHEQWNLNTGNGFYGGLQFSASTWNHYRAPDMPGRADWASVFQQVWVGEKVLDAQGWGAWPTCSRQAGVR